MLAAVLVRFNVRSLADALVEAKEQVGAFLVAIRDTVGEKLGFWSGNREGAIVFRESAQVRQVVGVGAKRRSNGCRLLDRGRDCAKGKNQR